MQRRGQSDILMVFGTRAGGVAGMDVIHVKLRETLLMSTFYLKEERTLQRVL